MQQILINHDFYCYKCKTKETFRGEDLRHCTFKAYQKGWSSTLALCPKCYKKCNFVQKEIQH